MKNFKNYLMSMSDEQFEALFENDEIISKKFERKMMKKFGISYEEFAEVVGEFL